MLVQLSNVVDLVDLVVEVLPDDCVCVGSSRSSCSVLSKAADCSFFFPVFDFFFVVFSFINSETLQLQLVLQ